MKKLNTVILACLISAVTGCVTPAMRTASGKPEVTIVNQNTETVKNAAVRFLINKGFMVEKSDAYSITMGKNAGTLASIFMGSRWDPNVYMRIVLNEVDMGNGDQRIIADPFLVTNRGGGFERNHEMGAKAMIQMQKWLNDVASTFGQTNAMPEVETASAPAHINKPAR